MRDTNLSRQVGHRQSDLSLMVVVTTATAMEKHKKRSYEEETSFVSREDEQRFRIDPGFVPNMRASALHVVEHSALISVRIGPQVGC